MQLGILLAVVATIMISEHAPAQPVDAGPLRILLTLATTLSVVLFAACGSVAIARAIRQDRQGCHTWLNWFTRLQQWHMAVWLTAIGMAIYGLHWPQVVRYNWGFDKTLVVRDLLILGPVWIPLLFSWAAFYEVERAVCGTQRMAFGPASRAQSDVTHRGQFVWLRARHYLGLCLLPILVLLAFQDLVTLVAPDWRENPFGWLLYLLPLAAVTLLFPQLLSRIWHTTPLPAGALRSRLEQLSRRISVRTRDFKIWQTRGQLLNAAVTGLIPSLRYVFLTDALLAQLREEEVESVVSHELGHIRRHHLWYRILLLALPIWIMGNVQTFTPALSSQFADWIGHLSGNEFLLHAVIIPALTVLYAVTVLGRYSRLLEHDADISVYYDGQGNVFCETIDRLSYLSHEHRRRRGWLHPSTISRLHLLQRSLLDPAVATRFRRRVDRLNFTLVAVWVLTPVVLAAC